METAAPAAGVPGKQSREANREGAKGMNSRTGSGCPAFPENSYERHKNLRAEAGGAGTSRPDLPLLPGKSAPFRGMGDMILKIDRLCDSLGFPEASPARRTLRPEGGPSGEEEKGVRFYHEFKEFGAMKGELFAVFLTLRYRQNVSWQGSVHFSGDAGGLPVPQRAGADGIYDGKD